MLSLFLAISLWEWPIRPESQLKATVLAESAAFLFCFARSFSFCFLLLISSPGFRSWTGLVRTRLCRTAGDRVRLENTVRYVADRLRREGGGTGECESFACPPAYTGGTHPSSPVLCCSVKRASCPSIRGRQMARAPGICHSLSFFSLPSGYYVLFFSFSSMAIALRVA